LAKGRPAVLAGLDIGTSKTVVVVAEPVKGFPRLLGVGESPSLGLRKGVVSDPGLASGAIAQALEKAEKASGIKVDEVYASFNGAGIKVRDCRLGSASGNCAFSSIPPNGFSAGIPREETVLQFIPPAARFEGFDKEQKAKAVTCRTMDVESVIESARLAGLAVKGVVYGPLAAAEALLTRAEKEFGTVLVDIGEGSTSISLFYKSILAETAVLSIGGEHLLGDLAVCLGTSLAQAREILSGFSLVVPGVDKGLKPGPGEIRRVNGGGRDSAGLIELIIEARINEILNIIAETIRKFNFPGLLPGGAVFCGGVSRMKGLTLLAGEKLRMPVRTGRVETEGVELDPATVNAFGLVRHGCARMHGEESRSKKYYGPGGLIGKFSDWFQHRTVKKDFFKGN